MASDHGLQIRTHHLSGPQQTTHPSDFPYRGLFLPKRFPQCFDTDVDSKFVAMLEAIGDRAGRSRDANRFTAQPVLLDPFCEECVHGSPDDADRRPLDPGGVSLHWQLNPHFMRFLSYVNIFDASTRRGVSDFLGKL